MASDLSSAIEQAAGTPREVAVDQARTQERDLRELIDADRYLKQAAAGATAGQGIRFTKLVPPGAV